MKEIDILIIGSGIVGAAAARAISQKSKKSIAVLEKEPEPAVHTSGRNSGVIHSGINPKPGGLKARFCVEGNKRLKEFCIKKKLPMQECGTVVVALTNDEIAVLEELKSRGEANGVPGLKIVNTNGLKKLEPNAAGMAALHSPSGAIASGREVTKALAADAKEKGVLFFFHQNVIGIEPVGSKIRVRTINEEFICGQLFNCAGLHADRIAHMMGVGTQYGIIPFRGEYYRIKSEKSGLVRSMVYPVPDLRYPFLGVHWTKTVDGDLKIGPNAIVALGREAYSRWSVHPGDTLRMLGSSRFWKMVTDPEFLIVVKQQWAISLSQKRFVEEAQKLIPEASMSDFSPWKSGIRAQLVNNRGQFIEDLIVEKTENSIHVLNAISPGFTCSLPFAEYLADLL